MKLSIVATLYKSEVYVTEFCERVSVVARTLTEDYEIVLVNDGSPDNSLQIAKQYADKHDNLIIIDLSRNFGHDKAMMTGLKYSSGDYIFLIDIDLEEEPEWLILFWERLKESGVDVVYGVQSKRRGGVIERFLGQLYYLAYRSLTGLQIPFNLVTARLMSRRYVDALTSFEEREMDLCGLWLITGFDQISYPVKKHSSSQTTYTFALKMNALVDSITSFSSAPLVMIFYIGIAISLIAVFFIGYLIILWFFFEKPPSGWTSVMASIWLLGGLVIAFIGIIGIYLSKVFSEAKHRPYTIIKDVYDSSYLKNMNNK